MLFEIINPSDKYTIETDDWQVACVANLVVGRGQLALEEIDGDHHMPLFLFGGLEEWTQEEFSRDLESLMDVDQQALANCLDSIVIGNRSNYVLGLGDKTGEEAEAFWEKWHDNNRSSTYDIGSYAKKYAAKLREANNHG